MKKHTFHEIKEFVSRPLFDEKIILAKDPNYPKVSIVTPSYNQAKFLERTILSVLNQNYPNLEYIIIDGGSTDGSVEIIKKYEKYLAYWVSELDEGQSDAINKGFKIAKGEILAYLNSDDVYCDGTIRKIIDFFAEKPEVGMVYGDCNLMSEKGKIIKIRREIDFDFSILFFYLSYIPQPTVFMRRRVLDCVGLLDENLDYSMDLDLYIRIAKNFPVGHIPELLANFRWHNESKSSRGVENFRKERRIIQKKYSTMCFYNKFCENCYYQFLRQFFRIKRILIKMITGKYFSSLPIIRLTNYLDQK